MKIKFNENEKTIEIKDGLKQQYFLMKMALIFTLINSVINSVLFPLFVLNEKQLKWMGFIWIILGITSTGILIYHRLKKTASDKLDISDISMLTEKQIFGRKRFSLKLKNGKFRDLMEMKKESDIIEMKKLFEEVGIKTT
ncbi:MAG TPA: hypothetical protein VIM94_10890 [Salegentibacter sp.]|uniref:hypothetical protein n=1 Tax=Salegentibacter sp. TaxID=1903072 RepID=UPI002F93A401